MCKLPWKSISGQQHVCWHARHTGVDRAWPNCFHQPFWSLILPFHRPEVGCLWNTKSFFEFLCVIRYIRMYTHTQYIYIYTYTVYIYIYIHTQYIYIYYAQYIYIFLYTYTVYIYIHIHTHTQYIYNYIYIYIYMHSQYRYTHIYIYIYTVYIYIYIHTQCIYIYIYIYIYSIYIYTYTNSVCIYINTVICIYIYMCCSIWLTPPVFLRRQARKEEKDSKETGCWSLSGIALGPWHSSHPQGGPNSWKIAAKEWCLHRFSP